MITAFPSRTETFAAREMECLKQWGLDAAVFAADPAAGLPRDPGAVYRRGLLSAEGWRGLWHLFCRRRMGLLRLAMLVCRLIPHSPWDAMTIARNIVTLGTFARAMDRGKIAHLHAYWLDWPSCIGVAMSVLTGRTLSIACHARDIFVQTRRFGWKIPHARFVTACTDQGLQHMLTQLPPSEASKMRLVRHGTLPGEGLAGGDPQRVPPAKFQTDILAVGRLVPKKGFEHLIHALSLMGGRNIQRRLTIVGDGALMRPLRTLARRLGVDHRVQFLGWQPHSTVMQFLRGSGVLAVPSVIAQDQDRDGTPNVILEAFACGLPVVASRLPGICEAVEHGRTGLLAEPGDAQGLAGALAVVLEDEQLRSRLSGQAQAMLAERFDARRNSGYLAELFREVLKCAPGG